MPRGVETSLDLNEPKHVALHKYSKTISKHTPAIDNKSLTFICKITNRNSQVAHELPTKSHVKDVGIVYHNIIIAL